MRIFVTGATGVIGRRALPLLTTQHTVTAGVRDAAARDRLTAAGVQCAIVDLFDPDSLRSAMAGHDTVINLATHIPDSAWKMLRRRAWAENDRIRSEGVRNLVDAARASDVTRFIQESFAPVYPDRGDAWIAEETPLAPTAYNRTVLDAERAVAQFAEIPERVGVVLRFGAFYGSDAFQTQAMIRAVRYGWAAIPGSPDGYLSSVSHEDAARAVASALTARSGAYNVVDDDPLQRREFFGSLAAALHVAPPHLIPRWLAPLFGATGELMARSLRISNQKLRAETGWRPLYRSVREGWTAIVTPPPSAVGRGSGELVSPR